MAFFFNGQFRLSNSKYFSSQTTTCEIQFDSDVKAMEIKLNGRGWFLQVTWFYTVYLLLAIICCWYITSLSIKVTFTNTAFITLGIQMLLQIGPLLHLGSKCYYGWDFYYAWVQMLLQMGPLLHLCPCVQLLHLCLQQLWACEKLLSSSKKNFYR